MADKPDIAVPPKWPEARDFMARLMALAGTDNVREFASRVGVPERYVYRWRGGESAPSFRHALTMLTALDVLEGTSTSVSERRGGGGLTELARAAQTLEDLATDLRAERQQMRSDVDQRLDQLSRQLTDLGRALAAGEHGQR